MVYKKIRVVHFLSSLSITSGVAAVIMNYYRNIDRDKIQFDFIYFCENSSTYENEINLLGGNIYKINKPGLKSSFYTEMNNILKKYDSSYTIFHNHETYLNIFINKIIKKNNIKALVVHSHTTLYSDKKINALRNKILCLPLKRQSDYFVACSKAAAKAFYGEKNIRDNKVFILNNAINCEKFKYNSNIREKIRKSLNLTNFFVIGHVGRFNNQKNHIFILKVFNEFLKSRKNSKLLLIGDGPLMNRVKEISEKMNLSDNVIFLGRRDNVNEILQAMDCFILPSLYEGLPVIGIEAQCAGLPCIFSKNITTEVDICNVKFLELNDSIDIWINSILLSENINRIDCSEKLTQQGFNIKNEAKKLENFYFKAIK